MREWRGERCGEELGKREGEKERWGRVGEGLTKERGRKKG